MIPRNTLKLSLAAVGIAVFLIGARAEDRTVRWTGIALVAAAWLLRFVGRGGGRTQDSTDAQFPSEDA